MLAASTLRENWTPTSPEEHAEVLRALEDVLASPYFCNSKRYPALLRYVVKQSLLGRGNEIKERTVGVDVFGRPPDYDTNLDTAVRYSAGEVRKRLLLYYRDADDVPIHICLAARSYHVEFLRLTETEPPAPLGGITASPAMPSLPQPYIPAAGPRKKRRFILTLAVALFVLAAFWSVKLWNGARNDAVSWFWSPVIDQKAATVISLGGVVFSPQSSIGTEVASSSAAMNPYLSFENGLAMGRVAALLNARGEDYRVQPAAATTLAQIRENPMVLVGAYNNDWTYRLVEPLRFHFTPHPDERIVDSQNPARFWMRDRTKPFNETQDYALIARFRNPTTDSIVVVIAGLQRFGTDAASQFVTSPHLLKEFSDRIGWNWTNKNVEAVLRVDVVNGRVGAPMIEAIHVW
jgi:hypothetical protein